MDKGNKVNQGEEVEKPCWQDDELVNGDDKKVKAKQCLIWHGKAKLNQRH